MSQRERYIGIGVGAVVALLVLDQMVLNPYIEKRDALKKSMAEADKKLLENRTLEDRHARLVGQWEAMVKAGMKTTPADAQLQFDAAMHDWALHAGLVPGEQKRQDAQPEKINGQMFQKSKVHFVGTGTMRGASLMIWSVETGVLPLHVDDVSLTSVKEGIDNIKIEMDVTMMVPIPDSRSGTPRTTVAAAGGY